MEKSVDGTESGGYARELRAATQRYERLITELSLLRKIDKLDALSEDTNGLCLGIVQAVASLLPVENVSIMLFDRDAEHLELRAACSPAEETGKAYGPGEWQGKRFKLGEGMVGRAAKTGEVVVTRDVREDARFVVLDTGGAAEGSLMCFPLRTEGRTLGVMNISNPGQGFLEAEAERILEMAAERIASLLSTHQLHARVRESERGYRLVTEYARDGILVLDAEGNVVSANPAIERISGIPAQRFVSGGLRWDARIAEADRAAYARRMRQVLEGGDPGILRYAYVDNQEGVHSVEQASALMRDGSAAPIGIVAVVRDVTREMQLERQLRQSQKMEAIGTLAGGIAHDFNNILSVIFGSSEMLLGNLRDDEESVELLQMILDGAKRARDLVRQILTFSRGSEVTRKLIRVQSAVRDAMALLRSTIPSTVDIVEEIAPECGPVLADPMQIQQVIINLCANAHQAMEPDGGVLTIGLEMVEPDDARLRKHPRLGFGKHVALTVSDTGCGMDEATMERIFEPFFTTKDAKSGTGLGLATVHGIVAHLGGAIDVSSKPGRGSTFAVYLPCEEAEECEEEIVEPPAATPLGRGEHVLLVDDQLDLLEVATRMIEELGYRVTACPLPSQALRAFEEEPSGFDIVVTDQTMPKLTGAQLAMRIREQRPDIPIVLTSGYSDVITPERAIALGIRAYLTKPFSQQMLGSTIRRLLDEREEQGAPAP